MCIHNISQVKMIPFNFRKILFFPETMHTSHNSVTATPKEIASETISDSTSTLSNGLTEFEATNQEKCFFGT